MNSNKSLAFLCTLLTLAMLVTPVCSIAADHKKGSGMHGSMMKHGHGHSYAKIIASQSEALQLTDEQLGKLIRLNKQVEKEHQQLMEKMHKSRHAFKKAMMQPGTDDETLDKLAKEQRSAHQVMIDHHLKERQSVHAILTAEQMSKLKTMKMPHGRHGDEHERAGHEQAGKGHDGCCNMDHDRH